MLRFMGLQRVRHNWVTELNWTEIVCMHTKLVQSCLTLCDLMDYSTPGSSVYQNSPDKNTGVGCHSLLQEIFPTQGSNPCLLQLLHHRQIAYCWATWEVLNKITMQWRGWTTLFYLVDGEFIAHPLSLSLSLSLSQAGNKILPASNMVKSMW